MAVQQHSVRTVYQEAFQIWASNDIQDMKTLTNSYT